MTGQKRESFAPPAVGGVSLLVVFAVLCLTVFALLSLSTVRADTRLGDASAQAVADYYAADCAAQEILAQIRAGEPLPADLDLYTSIDPDRMEWTYAYTCPISDTQALEVEVLFDGETYTILRWQAAPVGDWEFNDDLNLWDGELF